MTGGFQEKATLSVNNKVKDRATQSDVISQNTGEVNSQRDTRSNPFHTLPQSSSAPALDPEHTGRNQCLPAQQILTRTRPLNHHHVTRLICLLTTARAVFLMAVGMAEPPTGCLPGSRHLPGVPSVSKREQMVVTHGTDSYL